MFIELLTKLTDSLILQKLHLAGPLTNRTKYQQLRSQGILKDGQHRMLQHHTIFQQPNPNVLRRAAVQNLRSFAKKRALPS